MKRFLIFILFFLAYQFAYGQACGIYRIEYVGNIISTDKQIAKVYLPTTMLLHGVENEKSESAFISTTLTNGTFNIKISSHLTTPYNSIDQIISFYKQQSEKFILKVSYLENDSFKEKNIEIEWDKVAVSIVDDGKFGTLFRFSFTDLTL